MKRVIVAVLLMIACTNEEGAARTLRVQGYKNVQLTGYDVWGCGEGDGTCTGFIAVASNGERVSGAVGCGIGCGKHCTVRIAD